MKQTEIVPFMNHGRWIFTCPRCRTALMAEEGGVVCGVCWPESRARAQKPIPGGLFRLVPDQELVDRAHRQAEERGEVYVMKFPAEREQIESVLRKRPGVSHRNWISGETVDDLKRQNVERGDPVPAAKKKGGR